MPLRIAIGRIHRYYCEYSDMNKKRLFDNGKTCNIAESPSTVR